MAQKMQGQLGVWRQTLHKMPEAGLEETKTQAYLLAQLQAMRPDFLQEMAGTGIKCVFKGNQPGRVLAFRADMDALSIQEATGLPFASEHPGMMHACGHDGHMAALLGLALCVCALRDRGYLVGEVVLLFQPAEESIGGASRMIEQGALENPTIEEIYGVHMFPDVPLGSYSVCAGAMMASDYEFDIDIVGRSAHAAMPQDGINALDAANALYARLKALPQQTDPTQLVLLNIGRMEGGERRNIVPGGAQLQCVLRTFSQEALCDLRERIRIAALGTAKAYDVVITIRDHVFFPAVVNSLDLCKSLEELLASDLQTQKPLLLSEDFSFYQRERPGLFYFVGTGSDEKTHPLHSDRFDFDGEAMVYALHAHLSVLLRRCR